jgi:hypothetical protein
MKSEKLAYPSLYIFLKFLCGEDIQKILCRQMRWYIPVIPVLRRQEYGEFKASLGCRGSSRIHRETLSQKTKGWDIAQW